MFVKSTIHTQHLQSSSCSGQDSPPSPQGSRAEICYPEDANPGWDRAAMQRKQNRWRHLGLAARSKAASDVLMPARVSSSCCHLCTQTPPWLQIALPPHCKPQSRAHGSTTILINCWPGDVHILVVLMVSPQPSGLFLHSLNYKHKKKDIFAKQR